MFARVSVARVDKLKSKRARQSLYNYNKNIIGQSIKNARDRLQCWQTSEQMNTASGMNKSDWMDWTKLTKQGKILPFNQ